MRKPRSDSLFARLKPSQREQLLLHLNSGGKVDAGVTLVKSWGVETSVGAVSEFYSRSLQDLQVETFELAKSVANHVDGTVIDQGITAITRQKIFDLFARIDDPKVLLTMRKIELAAEKQDLDREKFKASLRTNLEKGMDALKAELERNPEAMKAFEAMQEALAAK